MADRTITVNSAELHALRVAVLDKIERLEQPVDGVPPEVFSETIAEYRALAARLQMLAQ